MKAEELMIGDWVLDKKTNRPYKIIGTNDLLFHDDYSHIPLTAEILEKIGFWYEQNVGYVMEEDEYEIIYDLWDHKLRILKNREQILNLEYWDEMCVHQLQHALRLCNIEKEIEL